MPADLTLALVLTAGGATVAAGVITGLIAMLKRLAGIGPLIDAGNEPTVAFFLSAALVAVAFATSAPHDVPSAFGAFLAWYGIAQVAMGIHDTVRSVTARGS